MSCAPPVGTVMFLAVDGTLAGAIAVGDAVKDSTPSALAALRADGLRIVMLTGDARGTAEAVAKGLGIDEVVAEVQPADKARVVEKLQSEGRRVAMAGDGINDAPALARAHVGIAMGTGTDIAMESAQVTLVKGDLNGIARARQLQSRDGAQYLAEPGLRVRLQRARYSDCGGRAVPGDRFVVVATAGCLAMSFSSVSVISNALRLRGK
jgi:Cu+-exporting ATPase